MDHDTKRQLRILERIRSRLDVLLRTEDLSEATESVDRAFDQVTYAIEILTEPEE